MGTFERLWDEVIELCRGPPSAGLLQESQLAHDEGAEFQVIHTLNATMLERMARLGVKGKGKGAQKGKSTEDCQMLVRYRTDKGRGEIYREAYWMRGGMADRGWIMVLQNPLRLESWTESPGVRLSLGDKTADVQDTLDRVLQLIAA